MSLSEPPQRVGTCSGLASFYKLVFLTAVKNLRLFVRLNVVIVVNSGSGGSVGL
jgi:hypothetical protein